MKKRRFLLYTLAVLLVLACVVTINYQLLPKGSRCQLTSAPARSVPSFDEAAYGQEQLDSLRRLYGKNKELPKGYEVQALLALSFYPELRDVRVRFIIGPQVLAPASSRPTVLSSLSSPEKREYLVFIDTDSELDIMDEILISRMPFNAQIGLIAHELGHSADYMKRNAWGMLQVLAGNASTSYMNDYEYQTDQCAIAHGAGYQLLAWSEFVYKVFEHYFIENPDSSWKGMLEAERYMFPETIRQHMFKVYEYPPIPDEQGIR